MSTPIKCWGDRFLISETGSLYVQAGLELIEYPLASAGDHFLFVFVLRPGLTLWPGFGLELCRDLSGSAHHVQVFFLKAGL